MVAIHERSFEDLLAEAVSRVLCDGCGEGVNYEREVRVDGRVLCRACAGPPYYVSDAPHPTLAADFA